jgi:dsDNA-binding SOS-regulon protein
MRNVSGYLTDDGRFFQDKKEAEAHERMAMITQRINKFVETHYADNYVKIAEALTHWENYRLENQERILRA